MTEPTNPHDDEALAAKRFYLMGAARIAGIAVLLLGLAIVQNALTAPYWLGAALSVIGMLGFFFGPYFLAKRWKSDRSGSER